MFDAFPEMNEFGERSLLEANDDGDDDMRHVFALEGGDPVNSDEIDMDDSPEHGAEVGEENGESEEEEDQVGGGPSQIPPLIQDANPQLPTNHFYDEENSIPKMPVGWPEENFWNGEEWIENEGRVHPQWSRDRIVSVWCKTCMGWWWDENHPYAIQRLLEMKGMVGKPFWRSCSVCGGSIHGPPGQAYFFQGRGWHASWKKWMIYLGGKAQTSWKQEGENVTHGSWYFNFPLFDYTYPTLAIFRPWAEGEKVPTIQEELPKIFRRAEFEFLPQNRRWWDVANDAEFQQNKRIRMAQKNRILKKPMKMNMVIGKLMMNFLI